MSVSPREREAQPAPGLLLEPRLLHLQREVAAEQVERAVRHVDHAHQAEDQREAARDDEVQRGERRAVERDDDEAARIVDGLDEQPHGDEGDDHAERDPLRAPAPAGRDESLLDLRNRAPGTGGQHRIGVRGGVPGVVFSASRHSLTAIESSCKVSVKLCEDLEAGPRDDDHASRGTVQRRAGARARARRCRLDGARAPRRVRRRHLLAGAARGGRRRPARAARSGGAAGDGAGRRRGRPARRRARRPGRPVGRRLGHAGRLPADPRRHRDRHDAGSTGSSRSTSAR